MIYKVMKKTKMLMIFIVQGHEEDYNVDDDIYGHEEDSVNVMVLVNCDNAN